eukprot:jgi/Botrbrau1/20576/Bobra.113_1s0002.1
MGLMLPSNYSTCLPLGSLLLIATTKVLDDSAEMQPQLPERLQEECSFVHKLRYPLDGMPVEEELGFKHGTHGLRMRMRSGEGIMEAFHADQS